MAWSKEEVESFIGGNGNTDALLDQCKESAKQSSFIIPSNNIPVDDPNRYIIEEQNYKDIFSVEMIKRSHREYLRSGYFALFCAMSGLICLAVGGKILKIIGAVLAALCFITIIGKTLRVPKKANRFYKSLVRSELGQYVTLEAYNDTEIYLGEWHQPDLSIQNLLDYDSDEELLARLNIGSFKREKGVIRNAFRGKIDDTWFRFIEFSTKRYYWSKLLRQYLDFCLFNGQCIVFQTSVSIPFPVQYDCIPIDSALKDNDFYRLFRSYRYQPENDIYSGLIIEHYLMLAETTGMSRNALIGISQVTQNVFKNDFYDYTEYLLDYYKRSNGIPQENKNTLGEEEQEIMNIIECEEFVKTLLSIAQTLGNNRWSIRIDNNNLIFIRPFCNTFELNINYKTIDEQLSKLEHEISNLVGILEIVSKLSIVQ